MVDTSVVPEEVEQFGRLAADWWDPRGSSAMLHRLNPVRLCYIRDWIDQHWALDEHSRRLLAEPLARLGAAVTAIDPAEELIGAAREHAAGQLLNIDYRVSAIEDVEGEFDLITAMEVIEHTADPKAFVQSLSSRLVSGGLLFLSTPNATNWSRLVTITLAEGVGAIPRGTHDFDKFIAPDRMRSLLESSGMRCLDFEGIAWSPTRGLHLSEDLRLNYLVAASRS
jgi:2-polyprenyl-6-hydroxyphenyl methylase/3-demethylubiquinone-9 3-methyltransferase